VIIIGANVIIFSQNREAITISYHTIKGIIILERMDITKVQREEKNENDHLLFHRHW